MRGPSFSYRWAFLCGIFVGAHVFGQDASIDKLLSKLPPPEKLAKPPVQRALQEADPAQKDPMARQLAQGARNGNMSQALGLSRKLSERYPRSAGAHCLQGVVAWRLRQFNEATRAFRAGVALEPRLALGHFGLALVEGGQGTSPQPCRIFAVWPSSNLSPTCHTMP